MSEDKDFTPGFDKNSEIEQCVCCRCVRWDRLRKSESIDRVIK